MTTHNAADQLYVYGIIPAEAQLPEALQGVAEAPVEVTASGSLAALVTGLDPDEEVGTPDNLLAHSTVVDTVAAQLPILPMTFGTIVPSVAELHDNVLAEREDEYVAALERLEGTAQYTVRARFIRDAVLADLIEQDPDVAYLREIIADTTEDETRNERIQLGELVVGAFDDIRPDFAQQIIDAVEPTVEDFRECETGRVEDVLELAVLVAHDSVADFDAALEDVAAEIHTRVQIQLLGPKRPMTSSTNNKGPAMGLLSGMFFGPIKGTIWVAEQLKDEAERQDYDPGAIRRELEEVVQARRDGRLTDEEATALEKGLIQRLLFAHRRERE